MPETSTGGAGRVFEPTRWTVVLAARDRRALDALIALYWKPCYFYIRRSGHDVEEAKDLTQGFFTEFVERDFLRGVSREKGRFRTYLLTTLKHFLVNERERAHAKKRGGGRAPLRLDFDAAETQYGRAPVAKESVDRYFRRQWALAVLSRALDALARETDPRMFEALKPHLAGGPAYADTAQALGLSTTAVNNLIHKTRKRYRELLRAEVLPSVDDPERVEEELRDLLDAVKA